MPWTTLETSTTRQEQPSARRLRRRIRFLVDENLGHEFTEAVREQGWNTKNLHQSGLLGKSDEQILALAYAKDRIVLTQDKDFLDFRRFPPHRMAGVIVLCGRLRTTEALLASLRLVLDLLGNDLEFFRGKTVHVAIDGIVRLRYRDLASGAMRTIPYRQSPEGRSMRFEAS